MSSEQDNDMEYALSHDFEAEHDHAFKKQDAITAPAKRLEFGEPWKCTEDRDDAMPYVEDVNHNVLLFDAPERILKRSTLCVNALAGLHIENGELRELLDHLHWMTVEKHGPLSKEELSAGLDRLAKCFLALGYQKVTAP